MLTRAQVHQIATEVESLGPDEALSLTLTTELPAAARAERLSEIQQVVDALRGRGRSPRVTVRRSENGELHALSLR
jgi:hypothetical protein